MTEDELVHQFNGHEFEETLGDSGGQGSLACCSPWGCQESDTTEQLNHHPLARGSPHSSSQDADCRFGNKSSGTPGFVIQSREDVRALP